MQERTFPYSHTWLLRSEDIMIFKKGELFNGPGGLSLAAKNAKLIHPETG